MLRTWSVLSLVLISTACTSEPSDGAEHGQAEDTHGEDTHAEDTQAADTDAEDTGVDTDPSLCEIEMRDDVFTIGLSKSGASMTATFVSASPAPPIKGDNTWVLTISDGTGGMLDDLDIVVNPMMPDHGHGTPIEAIATATGVPGEYSITPVNLFMTGYWEVTLGITSGDEHDEIVFGFCVE